MNIKRLVVGFVVANVIFFAGCIILAYTFFKAIACN